MIVVKMKDFLALIILEKLTNANTVNIPKTAIFDTVEILLEDTIMTVIDNKAVIIIANQGVFLFL
jgi:hypothetical protein